MEDQRLREEWKKAEALHTRAQRRAKWLERRMYDAQTEDEFIYLSSELDEQKKTIDELSKAACYARYLWACSTRFFA